MIFLNVADPNVAGLVFWTHRGVAGVDVVTFLVSQDDIISPISNRCSASVVGHQVSQQLDGVGEATFGICPQHLERLGIRGALIFIIFRNRVGHFIQTRAEEFMLNPCGSETNRARALADNGTIGMTDYAR